MFYDYVKHGNIESYQLNFMFVSGTAWGTAKIIGINLSMCFVYMVSILKCHAKYQYTVCYGYEYAGVLEVPVLHRFS